MSWEYKVVVAADIVPNSSRWQLPSSRMREWGEAMEAALNRMATDGWEFIDSCTPDPGWGVYLIFRRPIIDRLPEQQETAIQELKRD
jgi:hypothetical protein